jgi:hypothetical protein
MFTLSSSTNQQQSFIEIGLKPLKTM